MPTDVRYTFDPNVPFDEGLETLWLSLVAVEALHGEVTARLEAGHLLDRSNRVCVLDGATAPGRDLNALFCGYLRREFGAAAFRVDRLEEAVSA